MGKEECIKVVNRTTAGYDEFNEEEDKVRIIRFVTGGGLKWL